jgi:hypothetical protein
MEKKIAFVVTYFGELPFYFPAFQLSCKYNSHIQWLIFTDCNEPAFLPDNITFIKTSVDDFADLASQKLGYEIAIDSGYLYKICDFKPAFGVIYANYLKEYSFWGHCDIDIVWGQINHFINTVTLNNYDLITSRPGRVSGHFCLYRNTDKINSIFPFMPVTESLLKRVDSCQRLDEIHFTNYLQNLIKPGLFSRIKQFRKEKPFVPRIYWEKVLTTSGKHQRELYEKPEKYFKWKQGKVYHADGSEMMYLHFHKLKDSLNSINFTYGSDPDEFIVTTSALVAK